MQSNSETSDFTAMDFAAIRGLDPGGLYQVINIRNQEFIDHTFLGHVEIQEASLDVISTGPARVPHFGTNPLHQSNVIVDPGKITTYVQNLSVKPHLENGTNVIVDQRKDKQLATLTPIASTWDSRIGGIGEQQRSSGKVIQTNPGQYNFIECPTDLPPLVVLPSEKSRCSAQDLTDQKASAEEGKAKNELPHKKRLPRKKEMQKSTKTTKVSHPRAIDETYPVVGSNPSKIETIFTCQLCSIQSIGQLSFYNHLKIHYEVKPKVKHAAVQTLEDEENLMVNEDLRIPQEEVKLENNTHRQPKFEEEFSDPEDMLEGIRNVVDKVQEQSGEDDTQTDHGGLEWYSQDSLNVPDGLEHHEANLQGVPDNFVLYINKTDLEKINTENPIFSTQINEGATEKVVPADVIPAPKESVAEEEKKPQESSEDQEVVVKTRSGRKTRQTSRKIIQEPQMRISLGKRKKVKMAKAAKEVKTIGGKDGKKTHKKMSKCDVCGKELNSRNALKYHLLSHTGNRPHQCEVCGKAFYSSSALKVHKRLHSGVRPYACKHCSHKFRQWGDLKYHIASKHSDEKNHQCEFCGKDFARRYSLVIHRRIHTGEKNYACDYCSKTFRASSYLQNHRRIHTGEKPHPCTVCNKKFRVKGDMKRHMKIHGEKNEPREKVLKKKRKKKDGESNTVISGPPPEPVQVLENIIKLELNNVTYVVPKVEKMNSDGIKCHQDGKDQTKELNDQTSSQTYANIWPVSSFTS